MCKTRKGRYMFQDVANIIGPDCDTIDSFSVSVLLPLYCFR